MPAQSDQPKPSRSKRSQPEPSRSPGGRPSKPPEERRSEVVRSCVTPAEYKHIKGRAETAGLSVSAYIRHRLTRVVDKGYRIEVDRVMASAMMRIDELAKSAANPAVEQGLSELRQCFETFLNRDYYVGSGGSRAIRRGK